jgi:type I restriction enzyme S subunit
MKKIRSRANPIGTVIFPKIGGAIATNKRRLVVKPTIIDNNCSGIQPIGLTDSKWLLILMQSIDLKKYQTGTSVPAVSQSALDPIRIGLPPLSEQKRIVAKVDELMALCNRLETQLQERDMRHAALARAALTRFADAPTPGNIGFLFHDVFTIEPADLRKAILTLAIQGKLVPQEPNDEPAELLLQKIADEKQQPAAGKLPKQDPVAPITAGEIPFDVPPGWQWTRLSSITRRIHYGFTASASSEIKSVRLLRITDIQNNSVNWPTVPGCEISEQAIPQYRLEKGDILIARTGGTVGKTYLVRDAPVVAVFASYLIRIQGVFQFFDQYLKLFLESPTYWAQLEEGTRGGAQPNVNGQTLGRMVVPIPPLAEQRRIVAKVDQLMTLVDRLEAQLAASRAAATNLMNAVVAELTSEV